MIAGLAICLALATFIGAILLISYGINTVTLAPNDTRQPTADDLHAMYIEAQARHDARYLDTELYLEQCAQKNRGNQS